MGASEMTKKLPEVPSDASRAERRLFEALQRVITGDVTAPENVLAKQEERLELTQESVALEDGRKSRIPLCGSGARYPRVRDAIAEARRLPEPSTGAEARMVDPRSGDRETIGDLRRQLAAAKEMSSIAYTTSAASVILMRQLAAELAAFRQKPSDRAARRREAEARMPDYS